MGLEAFVRCRCWEDGRTAAPPAGVTPQVLGVDEDGFFGLLLPWVGNEELTMAVQAWVREACIHPDMMLLSAQVGNWPTCRLFQQALRAAGSDRFPTLLRELPDTNGGQTSAEVALDMLTELDTLRALPPWGQQWRLVDTDTAAVHMPHVAFYNAALQFGPDYEAGVGPDGFFVRESTSTRRVDGRELFRSHRFTQHVLPDGRVRLCSEQQEVILDMTPVGGAVSPAHRLHTESLPWRPADIAHQVDTLTALARAAVDTGNPVVWT